MGDGKNQERFRIFNRRTCIYSVVQILYWMIFCLMVAFASTFLLFRGLSSSRIGLVLGLAYLCSALLQPAAGAFFSRGRYSRSRGIAVCYIPAAVITFVLAAFPPGPGLSGALMMILIALQSMLQPSVNALSLSMETKEEAVNFAAARGTGSVAYALSSFAAGRLLAHFDPGILPWLYLAVQLALIAVLWTVRTEGEAPERGMREEKLRKQGNLPYRIMLRTYPHLRLFVPGMICLFCTYSFIDSFLIQIVLSIGGTNADLGTAITAGAILEFPAMLLYAWLCRKKLGMKVFRISIWIWLVKDVLTAFAGSTSALFAVQMMGVACCAIYVPGMMHYMRTSLPPGLLLRGATLAGTATTVGSLIAALTGGWLIDHAGVHRALLLSLIPAALGAWLMDRAIGRAARQTVGEALIKAFPAP